MRPRWLLLVALLAGCTPGGLDDALLRDAITVEARAVGEGDTVRLTLAMRTNAAGHAVPTGDVFRRLEVRAWLHAHPEPTTRQLAEAGYVAPHWPEPPPARAPPDGVKHRSQSAASLGRNPKERTCRNSKWTQFSRTQ